MIQEKSHATASGWIALALVIPSFIIFLAGLIGGIAETDGREKGAAVAIVFASALGLIVTGICSAGFFTVNPNESKVLQLFGKYIGSVRKAGFHWACPFFKKSLVSLRIRNFETEKTKVNDKDGNPIEIGAVVVWKVVDTAEASFEVDNYHNFVEVQSEAALRNLASRYPYDSTDDAQHSLRSHIQDVAGQLKTEIQERLAKAGVEVIEARISHLAYAPEIAIAMLQRQQAGAIIAARQRIVEGAVGMVEMALERLSQHKVIELDEERKAAMVSNLLVVLCGERATQPVVNAGTIYQ
jgi:regulator of protease activity HflC (stomatin/prohibitin superfamily)